jgi:two-component system chemotaxis response regulator CheY
MSDLKCLIVEDSSAMRQLLKFALSRIAGLETVESDDGMDGLKKLSSDRYDLLIVDINMPIMDGLKLVKAARNDGVHGDVPILVVSTEGAAEDRERCMQLGVNVYLVKPVQATEVVKEAKKLLGLGD